MWQQWSLLSENEWAIVRDLYDYLRSSLQQQRKPDVRSLLSLVLGSKSACTRPFLKTFVTELESECQSRGYWRLRCFDSSRNINVWSLHEHVQTERCVARTSAGHVKKKNRIYISSCYPLVFLSCLFFLELEHLKCFFFFLVNVFITAHDKINMGIWHSTQEEL